MSLTVQNNTGNILPFVLIQDVETQAQRQVNLAVGETLVVDSGVAEISPDFLAKCSSGKLAIISGSVPAAVVPALINPSGKALVTFDVIANRPTQAAETLISPMFFYATDQTQLYFWTGDITVGNDSGWIIVGGA